jgi:uncharacterized Zn finger protein (UPF0148 family)
MFRTNILCPECFQKHLLDYHDGEQVYCDECGTEFEYVDESKKVIRYK